MVVIQSSSKPFKSPRSVSKYPFNNAVSYKVSPVKKKAAYFSDVRSSSISSNESLGDTVQDYKNTIALSRRPHDMYN